VSKSINPFAPLTGLAAALARREMSAVELAEFYLARIERANGKLNAFVSVESELARALARASDARRAAGVTLGPLDGLPIALKDLLEIAGRITTVGSALWRERRSKETAIVVERLLAAGMVILGKTAYVQAGAAWIDPRVRGHVDALADPDTGLAADVNAVGRPWQEPDEATESLGRTDLHAAIDSEGRRTDTRSDLGSAFGDWESIREKVHELAARAPERIDTDVAAALRSAERDPAGCSDDEYLALATADGPALDAVAALADSLRKDVVGDDVTFVVNRNINFTNICYTGCRFCAFAQRKGDADAYSLSTAEVAERAWEAHVAGATEVCMQGGIDPELPVTGYADLVRAVKARVPSMHVHAFSPMEIANGVTKSGLSIREWLTSLREAGLGSIPGTAAEILDDEVRWVLTKGKLPTSMWIEVVTTAHEVGLRSSSTMMYGHVDQPHHWVGHLNVLRRIQDQTGGFTEFVPLPFVHQSSPLYLAGGARPGPTHRDNRAVHALARIMLHGRISNIQTSWVKLGVERTQVMLTGGANDLGGTLMEETISRMAGSEFGSAKSVEELVEIAAGIGRPARQRSTTYAPLAA